MPKINILPAKVYNRIAAGEVVDRPYSVVKELIENSIDAGATEIQVYVEKGGTQLIRVADNGCGIGREDLHSAFLPHATSKIAKAEDLEKIVTLGFRGEAVASIASVSKMTITSKTANAPCYRLTSNGGELGEITQTADESVGTDVQVEMLFFNTPVRLGFLKAEKTEEAEITACVSRFILGHSDIAFVYYLNGKKVLQSYGGGMEEALAGVYGASVLERLIKIDADKHGLRIRGYIGDQNFYKANKSYQTVFLNGRYILNTTIATAMTGAYSTYLMKRQYPFYVLYIDMPTEFVDVNVHPNKIDVRFADNRIVYGSIYNVVTAVLDGNAKALEYIEKDTIKQEESEKTQSTISSRIVEKNPQEKVVKQGLASVFGFNDLTYEQAQKEIEAYKPVKQEDEIKAFTSKDAKEFISYLDGLGKKVKQPKNSLSHSGSAYARPQEKNAEKLAKKLPLLRYEQVDLEAQSPLPAPEKVENIDYFEENKKFLAELERQAKQTKIDVSSCKYAGKLFNTYLIYERGDEMYFIDQHAAHERLIFDKLKARMQNREVMRQPMLVPFYIRLNHFESEFIYENIEHLREMGFDIEMDDRNGYFVHAVPIDLQKIDLNVFFNELLGEVNDYRAIKLEEILKDKLASAACKSAVKAGRDLTDEEVFALFNRMDGNLGLKCPHGRPVVVKMTKTQIEKMFKRIV